MPTMTTPYWALGSSSSMPTVLWNHPPHALNTSPEDKSSRQRSFHQGSPVQGLHVLQEIRHLKQRIPVCKPQLVQPKAPSDSPGTFNLSSAPACQMPLLSTAYACDHMKSAPENVILVNFSTRTVDLESIFLHSNPYL